MNNTVNAKRQNVKLTKREVEVMNLASQGMKSQAIADALYTSKRTVDFHFANIFDKFQVKDRFFALKAFEAYQVA